MFFEERVRGRRESERKEREGEEGERGRGRRESERRGTYLLKESLALEGNGGDSLWELAAEGPEPRPQVLLIQRGIHV